MTADFIALDLETANSDFGSICQIGMVRYRGGEAVGEWASYIDPKVPFAAGNIGVHGITAAMVRGCPSLPVLAGRIRGLLDGEIVISHGHFDRVALGRAFERHNIPRLRCRWLDSLLIARRAWGGLQPNGGYGLANLCRILGYRYQHHDALADAKAAGVVVLAAMEQTGLGLDEWRRQVQLPVGDGPQVAIRARLPGAAGRGR